MVLPFLDRREETARLRRLLRRREGGLAVLYGRRRCGKSRLLGQVLGAGRSIYYVGDDRESVLQRSALATEIGRLLPGFDRVTYPGWDGVFERLWSEAPAGTVVAMDEFPALAAAAREIPGLLQKHLDRSARRGVHLLLAGSSQRMMQGLVLDRTAPLFGRAVEILKITPLPAGWILPGLSLPDAVAAIEAFAVWGGVPRYWELAAGYPSLDAAVRELILSP
ncbi:MAG: ATP-binding protein, partial [Candidatus Eisenbacteria bacterium]